MGGLKRALTVWLFNMNWTALSLTSFLTLLYVSKPELRRKRHHLHDRKFTKINASFRGWSSSRISQRKIIQ